MEYLKEDEQTFSVLLEGEFQSAGTLRACAKLLLSRLVESRKRVEELEQGIANTAGLLERHGVGAAEMAAMVAAKRLHQLQPPDCKVLGRDKEGIRQKASDKN